MNNTLTLVRLRLNGETGPWFSSERPEKPLVRTYVQKASCILIRYTVESKMTKKFISISTFENSWNIYQAVAGADGVRRGRGRSNPLLSTDFFSWILSTKLR